MKRNSRIARTAGAACLLLLSLPGLSQRANQTNILRDTFGYDEDTKKSVSLEDLHQGCSIRDCIVSIDNPKYVAAGDASHVADDDIVLALSWKGYHRAWPANILDQHEIVNDIIGGTPMAITWCPLCGSAVGVIREVDGRVTEFGVSGLLYNSDLVFYDRATETLWDQIIAKGIVGPLTDVELELVPITMTRWGRWKEAHPDTLVLSADTGFMRDYSRDAYARYRGSDRLMFPVSKNNDAIRPKSVVFGFDLGEHTVAFTESHLQGRSALEYQVEGRTLSVTIAEDGAINMTDPDSGEQYSPTRLYWFAWYTFHPETVLVR